MKPPRMRLAALSLLLAACSGLAPAFDARFADNDDARTARALARITDSARAHEAQEPLVVVAASDDGKPSVIVADFTTGVRARSALDAESRPELFGDLVLVVAAGSLHALDAHSGQPRWSRPLAGCAQYLGAARDADRIAYACEAPPSEHTMSGASPSLLRGLAASDGHVLWQRTTDDALGRPAASNGLLLVPWQRQGLAMLDARDGVELARLRSRDDVIDWARSGPGFAWFGHRQAYFIGPHGYSGSRKDAVALSVTPDSLPGRPALVESAYAALPGGRSAYGRVALSVLPVRDGEHWRAHDDRAYFTFYRYIFAYDGAGALRWCRTLAHDVIASRALPGGLALATDAGELLLLGADDGGERARKELGLKLAAASLHGDAPVPAAAAGSEQPALRGGAALRNGLLEVALDIDQRLVPARAYAVEQLARLPEPEVTADLLHIYERSTTPPELQSVVASQLRTRRIGLEHVIDALLQRYDFLEQTRPAPLAVLVPALLDAHEPRALPNLIARMLDHETPLANLPSVVHAVVELGDERVVEPLFALLRLYRADSTFADQPEALIEAARGVLVHGGPAGAQRLAELMRDGIVTPGLASGVAALLTPKIAAPAREVTALAAAAPPVQLPGALAPQVLRAAFAVHDEELRACLAPELARNAKLAQVRIALIVESDGSTHSVHVAPVGDDVVDCMYPKLAQLRFPRFRSGRQVATYLLPAHAPELAAAKAAASASEDESFWSLQAAHPRALAQQADPWWHSKQPIVALALPRLPDGSGQAAVPSDPSLAPSRPAAPATAESQAAQAGAAIGGAAAPALPAGGSAAGAADAGVSAPSAGEDAWWVPAGKK